MTDERIIEMYFDRDEHALVEVEDKYGKFLTKISFNILYSRRDAEECVNDAYAKSWEVIPPNRPYKLSTFLAKITRNISLNRYEYNKAKKRNSQMEITLSEVEEFLPSKQIDFDDEIAIKDAIDGFLSLLDKQTRIIFVRRYFYMSSIKEIAKDYRLKEGNVKVILHRTRQKFKEFLEREGI